MVVQSSDSQMVNQLCINHILCLVQSQDFIFSSHSIPQQFSSLLFPNPTHKTFGSTLANSMLQFLTLNIGDSRFTVSMLDSHLPETKLRYHWQPIDNTMPVMTQASCFHWTIAIIQKLWNTAWDLLTHWNIEIPWTGLGLPNSTVMFFACHSSGAVPWHCSWPKYPSHYQSNLFGWIPHMLLW